MTEPSGVEPPWMDDVDRMLREGGVEQFLTPANGGPPIVRQGGCNALGDAACQARGHTTPEHCVEIADPA